MLFPNRININRMLYKGTIFQYHDLTDPNDGIEVKVVDILSLLLLYREYPDNASDLLFWVRFINLLIDSVSFVSSL